MREFSKMLREKVQPFKLQVEEVSGGQHQEPGFTSHKDRNQVRCQSSLQDNISCKTLGSDGDATALSHAASLLARNEMFEEVMVAGDSLLEPLPSSSEPRLKLPHPRISMQDQGWMRDSRPLANRLQALTDFDGDATVVSVDGVGAFDLISRVLMMKGLRHAVSGESIIPFAIHGQPSAYLWEDDAKCIQSHRAGRPSHASAFLLGSTPSVRCHLSRVARW